ncbi:MAG: anti-sigma F factor [Oscillospiraceae bacterium]|nr:anti-sigma F factor [Oscillospiraceae bacterium]
MKTENYAAVEFLSRSSNEGFARMAAAAFAAQLDPTLDELGDIKTAVSEAVTNAIVHAYPDRIGKIVMKMKILNDNILELSIRDWGCGIENVEQARQPLFTTGGEERSGMGFTIMESFTDRLTVKSTPQRGTCVTMRKRIAQRLSGRK